MGAREDYPKLNREDRRAIDVLCNSLLREMERSDRLKEQAVATMTLKEIQVGDKIYTENDQALIVKTIDDCTIDCGQWLFSRFTGQILDEHDGLPRGPFGRIVGMIVDVVPET
jgi:hypothetical protein